MESPVKKRRVGRDGRTNVDVFTMVNNWKDGELKILSDVMNTMPIDDARSSLIDRYVILEKMEANKPSSFAQRSHYFGTVVNFVTPDEEDDAPPENHLITIKVFNQSGEIDGAPSDEHASQLWLMPEIGTAYKEDDGVLYVLVEYDLPILSGAFKVKEPSANAAAASACVSPG